MRLQRFLGTSAVAGIVLAVTALVVHADVSPARESIASQQGPAAFPAGGRLAYRIALPHSWDHVGPLAYDQARAGLWFVSSSTDGNRLNFYDIGKSRLTAFGIPSTEINLLEDSGIGVAPDGSVWFAFGSTLGQWDGASRHVQLVQVTSPPLDARFSIPVPVEVSDRMPYRGLVIDRSGGVWVGRLGVAGLLHISPTRSIDYFAFPQGAGDVRGGQLQADGAILWTTEFSRQHPGMLQDQVLRVDPTAGHVDVFQLDAQSLAADGTGGFYSVRHRLVHVSPSGNATRDLGVQLLGDSIATDQQGRVWFQDQTAPAFDRYDPKTGVTDQYVYPAQVVMVHTLGSKNNRPVLARPHLNNMVVDSVGNLWFSVLGGNQIGEVSPAG